MTACGQLAEFCADDSGSPAGATCLATGQAGLESACLSSLATCLPVCLTTHATPCSGLCENPVSFTVPDGDVFQSGQLGTGAGCFETTSELWTGASVGFSGSRDLTVNGVEMPPFLWEIPLPTQRHHGYCIQTTPGSPPWAGFAVW
jgi:hypothetical protein